jgi:hypothetical protein
MVACRHPIRPKAHGRRCGTEESLHHRHVAMFAQHGIDQVALPVDRPAQVDPSASELQGMSHQCTSLRQACAEFRTGASVRLRP